MKLHMHVHDGRNVALMREALENYVLDNANVWESIVFFRCEEIDTDNEFVEYRLAVRSRHSWQIASRVLMDRAKLHQFTISLAQKMEVAFDSPQPRRILYYGGSLVEGAVEDYKKDLLKHRNLSTSGDLGSISQQGTGGEAKVVEEESIQDSSQQYTSDEAKDAFLAMIQQGHL
jgi:hypothetical protein